jgi:hypothetical protein
VLEECPSTTDTTTLSITDTSVPHSSIVEDNSLIGVVIGSIVGALCCALILTAIGCFVLKFKHNDDDNNYEANANTNHSAVEMTTAREDSHCTFYFYFSVAVKLFFLHM